MNKEKNICKFMIGVHNLRIENGMYENNKRPTGLNGHLSILAHTGSLIFAFLKSLNTV